MAAPAKPRTSLRDYLRSSWRVLFKEVAAFGVVGAMALVIDLGIFAWLQPHGALKAKIVSTFVSFFFLINAIVLVFSLLIIALFVYPLHFPHGSAVVFVVNVCTIGLGTIFRFWAYKRFVFLHPDRVRDPRADLDEELAE
jgi:uncharacterized membrane protein YbhN (UPF0104 family)